jgi:tetratricopeptide (TPR) repeat protein
MSIFIKRDFNVCKKNQAIHSATNSIHQVVRTASNTESWSITCNIRAMRHTFVTVFALFMLVMLLGPLAVVSAGESVHPPAPSDETDAGVIGPGLLSYRLGNYYYVTEDYERAAEYFADAIARTPERIFGLLSEMSCFHWGLFDAQIALEQYEDAAATYAAYVAVAGAKADRYFADYVQDIATSLEIAFLIGGAWA